MSWARAERRGRAGFTLLELAVALAAGGLALAGASATLLTLAGRTEALREEAVDVDRRANAEGLVRLLAGNLRIAGDSLTLVGDREAVAFPSWCESAGVALVPCRVKLRVEQDGPRPALVLETREDIGGGDEPDGPLLVAAELWTEEPLALRYLVDAAWGGTWSDTWNQPTQPLALGVLTGVDTLILPLGGR